jgi:hypothetical protein
MRINGMSPQPEILEMTATTHERPRNKAAMDQPQEEFIQASSSHVDDEDELQFVAETNRWQEN